MVCQSRTRGIGAYGGHSNHGGWFRRDIAASPAPGRLELVTWKGKLRYKRRSL